MAKRGAKSKYETNVKPYLETIKKKVRQGITEAAIAEALGISVATLNNYKNKYDELKDVLTKDKGADILDSLLNSGIEAAKGYYKENETTVIALDENGKPSKRQVTKQKIWFPPNPVLHKFYVLNFGKNEGYVNDPLDYDLRKARQELAEAEAAAKNWDI
jgi:transcriptional regulator with XRE-family HTH domain